MPPTDIRTEIDVLLTGRRLLEHPFYRRWEAGELTADELRSYAEQYRHFEEMLPSFLAELAGRLPDSAARDLVEANLVDECSDPEPHIALFEDFAAAFGAGRSGPSPATARLVETYRSSLGDGAVTALGVLAAYEVQAADVAASKAEGLRRHFGTPETGTRFWDVHAEVDRRHAQWVVTAVGTIASEGDRSSVRDGFRRSADAWWRFLDERESCRPVDLQPA